MTPKNEYRRARRLAAALLLVAAVAGCATAPPPRSAANAVEPDVESMIVQGDIAFRKGEFDQAVVEYVKALAENPEQPGLLNKIGAAQRELGRLDVAERAYAEALALRDDDAAAHEGLGLIYLDRRAHARAGESLQRALDLEPGRWRSLNALGILADLAGEPERARSFYGQALASNSGASVLLNNIGYSYYLSGDWTTAKRYYEEALSSDNGNDKAWSNLGLLYVRQQEYDQAVRAFRRIMDPAQALNSVGYMCMVVEHLACAEEHLSRAISASSSYYDEAHENLARVRSMLARN